MTVNNTLEELLEKCQLNPEYKEKAEVLLEKMFIHYHNQALNDMLKLWDGDQLNRSEIENMILKED